jgi:hypothetical protein
MFRGSRTSFRTRLGAIMVGAGLLAAGAVAATAGPASADTVVNVHYSLTGTTFIKKLNTTFDLGSGTLSSAVDLDTATLTSTLSLPPGTLSFEIRGVPVTVTTEIVQNGPASGSLSLSAGTITSAANVTLKVADLTVGGVGIPIGDSCQTSPFTIDITSGTGFSIIGGGPLNGTFTIPSFGNCLLGTAWLNAAIPGPGNTLNLTLGGVQIG